MKKTIVLGAVLILVLAVGGWIARDAWIDYQRCEARDALAAEFGTDPIGSGPRVVTVLGDSYTEGMDLDEPRQSWVATFADLAGATVTADAASGTGFTTPGSCDRGDFVSRAVPGSGLLIVQGGLNDVDAAEDDIEDAACAVIARHGDRVAVVGPPPAPARDLPAVQRVDSALAAAAESCGADYISTLDWDLSYSGGSLHMTPAGHREFGSKVAAAIS